MERSTYPRTINLDREWQFRHGVKKIFENLSGTAQYRTVNLPHDYMIESDVREDAPAASASGFYTAGVAHYLKNVLIPAEWEDEEIFLHFDGAMMNTTVDINGDKAALHHYGYAPFAVDITGKVYCGQENEICVTVNPSMQPNSRWYSGAGIHRSLSLVHTPKLHIKADGIYGCTKSIDYDATGAPVSANIQTEVEVANHTAENHIVRVEVFLKKDGSDEELLVRSQKLQVNPMSEAAARVAFNVENPALWSAETPNLYRLGARVIDLGIYKTHFVARPDGSVDETDVLFGIRTVTADAVHGLRINGVPVKLRGGCLHHDNGMLGAVSLYDIEERKLKALQAIGFNAVRTTHNPPSSALIEACDRLGIYVFDEAFDAWGDMKQPGDYNMFFDTDWEEDLTLFMKRDRSHPSVILWSTGNEITERAGLNNGYTLATKIAEKARSLDASRPISNAICSFWNGLDNELMAENFRKMQAHSQGTLQNADSGAEDLTWEELTEPFANSLDIVGYNYLEDRYEQDHRLYPDRVILGSENYPKEIGLRWPLVESRPCYLGDFTWTAFDYLGEAGIGKTIFLKPDDPAVALGARALSSHTSVFPWRLANDADVDINGGRMPQGDYRSVVWGSDRTCLYSYDPDHYGMVEIISAWGFVDVVPSWNWPGREGKPVSVLVFSNAEEVALQLNGREIGRLKAGEREQEKLPKSFLFDVPAYEPGTLTAVSFRNGAEISRDSLETTGNTPAALRLTAEKNCIPADGHSLTCVTVEVTDEKGRRIPDACPEMRVELKAPEGCAAVAAFGSANPITAQNYTAGTFTAYRGRATAIVRSGYQPGTAVLSVTAGDLKAEITLEIQ